MFKVPSCDANHFSHVEKLTIITEGPFVLTTTVIHSGYYTCESNSSPPQNVFFNRDRRITLNRRCWDLRPYKSQCIQIQMHAIMSKLNSKLEGLSPYKKLFENTFMNVYILHIIYTQHYKNRPRRWVASYRLQLMQVGRVNRSRSWAVLGRSKSQTFKIFK